LRGASEGNKLNAFIETFSLTDANTRKKIIKLVPKTVAAATVAAPTVAAPTVPVPPPTVPAPATAPVKKQNKKLVVKEKK
jgi:hypothetical protein